jgi:CDP-diglyceride synthetase
MSADDRADHDRRGGGWIGAAGAEILRDSAAALFSVVYIGLPLGALAAVRASGSRGGLLLMMATIVINDSARYRPGAGKRPLAPAISPKKMWRVRSAGWSSERWHLCLVPDSLPEALLLLLLVGASVSALGMWATCSSRSETQRGREGFGLFIRAWRARSIDSWLFAAPVYYVFCGISVFDHLDGFLTCVA